MSNLFVDVCKEAIRLDSYGAEGLVDLVKSPKCLQKFTNFSNKLGKIFNLQDSTSKNPGIVIQAWEVQGFTKESVDKITKNEKWTYGGKAPLCDRNAIAFIAQKLAKKFKLNAKQKVYDLDSEYKECLKGLLK